MANGATRVVLAEAQNKKMSQAEINAAFKDENEVTASVKKMPSRSAVEHNHSSDSFRTKK